MSFEYFVSNNYDEAGFIQISNQAAKNRAIGFCHSTSGVEQGQFVHPRPLEELYPALD